MPASPFLYQSPIVLPSFTTHPQIAPSINYRSSPAVLRTTNMPFSTSECQSLPQMPSETGVYNWDPGRAHSWSQPHFHVCQALTYFPARPKQVMLIVIQQGLVFVFFFFSVTLNMGHNPELWTHRAQS